VQVSETAKGKQSGSLKADTENSPSAQKQDSGISPGPASGVSTPSAAKSASDSGPTAERGLVRYERDVSQPDLNSGTPAEVWGRFFAEHRPAPRLVSEWVLKLHNQKQYPQVIACLQAALINGQAQPWMYEVLALSMEIEQFPKEAIERVVLSLSDFGDVDFGSMMYSGAYLTRFGRQAAALTMYRQASRLLPERSEPYLLGLKLARDIGTPEDVAWASTGILMNYWQSDYTRQHQLAEAALQDQISRLKKANQPEQAQQLQSLLTDARSLDLSIRLDWNGAADLDLQVEEPSGSVCGFETVETPAGGIFLHDGVGPDAANAYEFYVCPRGVSGPYRVRVRNAGGPLVGNRATLTVTMHSGLPDQSRFVRTLVIDGEEVMLTVDLNQGRRTRMRLISALMSERTLSDVLPAKPGPLAAPRRDPQQAEAMQQLMESRQRLGTSPRAGAMGYAPVIQVIPEGTALTAQPVVSPDRRYIRLGIQPVFNDVTDVFTFTYFNNGNR